MTPARAIEAGIQLVEVCVLLFLGAATINLSRTVGYLIRRIERLEQKPCPIAVVLARPTPDRIPALHDDEADPRSPHQ